MASKTEIKPDQAIPSVTKSITENSILEFESTGILDRENIHNNPELAAKRLGTTYTLASGRMSITFAAECMRKFFGPDVFNHTGTVNLKFLRPVKAGDRKFEIPPAGQGRGYHHRHRSRQRDRRD